MLKTQAIGHLGNDAVVNNVNGKNVINFNVAHSEKYKNAEGIDVNRTVWVSCAYWTDKLNIANYLKKGTQVYVEGQPSVKTYQDKEGRTQPQLSLRVSSIQLLGSKQDGNNQQPQNTPTSFSQPQDLTEPVDDLPF